MPKIIRESNEYEVEFPQKGAIINFGISPLSTYNLVNCIAIGGSFKLKNESVGSFLTHESPTDYITLQTKLRYIFDVLNENSADILFVVLFHCEDPGKDKYQDLGGMTRSDIVKTMRVFCENTFPNVKLIMKTYSNSVFINGTFLAGKATISPTDFYSTLFANAVTQETTGRQTWMNLLKMLLVLSVCGVQVYLTTSYFSKGSSKGGKPNINPFESQTI